MATTNSPLVLRPKGGAVYQLVALPGVIPKATQAHLDRVCTVSRSIFRKRWVPKEHRRRIVHDLESRPYLKRLSPESSIQEFPAGWFSLVADVLSTEGLEFEVVPHPCHTLSVQANVHAALEHVIAKRPGTMPELRSYQVDGALAALLRAGGTVAWPTGAGKTLGAALIIEALHRASEGAARHLYVVPWLELLTQTVDCLRAWGVCDGKVGVFSGAEKQPNVCTVATIQSLWAGLREGTPQSFLKSLSSIILDECHHVDLAEQEKGPGNPNTWFRVALACPAWYRIGFSATPGGPKDPDYKLLTGAVGPIVHQISLGSLVEAGYLARPRVHLYPMKCPREDGTWQHAYRQGILENKKRNELISALACSLAAEGKKVLITVARVAQHGRVLEAMIQSRGGLINFASGKSTKKHRARVKREFKSGETPILIGTIYGEGVDIPEMDAVILADAFGAKFRPTIQRTGRVLRKRPDKETGLIVDFLDDDDHGVLSKWSRQRCKVYNSDSAYEVVHMEVDGAFRAGAGVGSAKANGLPT